MTTEKQTSPVLNKFFSGVATFRCYGIHSPALGDKPAEHRSLHDETSRRLRVARYVQAPSRLQRSVIASSDESSVRRQKVQRNLAASKRKT